MHKTIRALAGLACAMLCLAATPVLAGGDGNNPVGTWLVTVSFPASAPPAPPPFQEFISLHHNGTLTETNGSLHANPVPVSPLNLTASEGFGAWKRSAGGQVRFRILKMVFCGPGFDPATDPGLAALGCAYEGQHLGYLEVSAEASFLGDAYSGGQSTVQLLLGPDPEAPYGAVDFGSASSEGKRIKVQAR